MASSYPRIAVLGPLGTYTHEAAFRVFGHQTVYEERKSIADVFTALSGSTSLGVVAQENSIYGSVVETYDLLRSSDPCFVCGEITLKVEHCLLTRKGVRIDSVKRVMSHEQALGQCRHFISEHLSGVELVQTTSTAAAAKAVLDNPGECAAICAGICATLFEGTELLFTGIQDEKANFTRFYILCSSPHTELPVPLTSICHHKALLRIHPPLPGLDFDNRGHDITSYLNSIDLFVVRFDRRPSVDNAPFHSVYFVEVHGCKSDERTSRDLKSWRNVVQTALERVRKIGGEVDLMGIW